MVRQGRTMMNAYELRLKLHSGVPVVDVLGEWLPAASDALTERVSALASAGHYEIVVNVQKVATDGRTILTSLTKVAEKVRDHHGHLDLVGTAEQWEQT